MRQQTFSTTCSYCGVGCGILVQQDTQGRLSVSGDPDHPVNRGMLCSKGMNLHHVVADQSDRIKYPAMRWSRHHPLQKVSWDTALERSAAVFRSLIDRYGPDSVGFYVSGQCLTEEYYLINKLVKGFIGTNNIDTNSRLCMSSAVAAYMKTLGEDSVPISYDDIELADCFMIAGANPAWCHPILFRRLEAHKAANPDIKVIVVDPRKTQSCSIADLHLQIRPGTDTYLYLGIGRHLLETGAIDDPFIKQHTEAFRAYREVLLRFSLKQIGQICGIDVNQIKLAARYIGGAKGFISMWAMGLNQSVVGVDKNLALLNLSLMTGQIGKPGAGPFSLTGQPNAMGGREVGGMASLLAAHRDLHNPDHRREVADFWGVEEIQAKPGLTATQMFEALESGKMKAVWIICTNPVVSLPNARKVENALARARFVVVQDISHRSDTAAYADVLLPAAGWLEKAGTMTNSDRRVSYLPRIINPPGEALPDAEIIWRFANHMGYSGFDYRSVSEVYDEYCLLTKGTHIDVSGLGHDRLRREGTFQWPVPSPRHSGTPRLFTDKRFYTPSGKARFNVPQHLDGMPVKTDTAFPFILTTGRVRDQWHTMTRTGKVSKLKQHIPEPFLEMHPTDARPRMLTDGQLVVVNSRQGTVRVKLKITEQIRPGVIFLPMHWGKVLQGDLARANNLTETRIDPVSKQPDFKFTPVSVKAFKKPTERICVIGAGAAAFRWVQSYREHNRKDSIQVFSKEAYPFYNRVLLPEYATDHLAWEALQKLREGELARLQIDLRAGIQIQEIIPEKKLLIDQDGRRYSYDKLVIATGSRAHIPREVPLHIPGIFSMRNRGDADRLRAYLQETGLAPSSQHVTIVGGGLLGLEMASALRKQGLLITLIQRSARLMERQLDPVAAKLLSDAVQDMGIQVHFSNEVSTIFKGETPAEMIISLKSGKILASHALIYCVGTRPNIELARAAGLKCSRGIQVNEYLQTSDPHIFAIGEIAAFQERQYGITDAAEQQADSLARYMAGDMMATYQGSVNMNILKVDQLDLCSIGEVRIPAGEPGFEQVILLDEAQRFYKKCVFYQGRMVGAILLGDKAEFAEYKQLIAERIELGDKRLAILRGASQAAPLKGELVCSCASVGRGNLEDQIAQGHTDLKALCKLTGAGLGCGSCKPEIQFVLDQSQANA